MAKRLEITEDVKKRVLALDTEGRHSRAGIARQIGISERSVYKILGERSPDRAKELRRDKMVRLQDLASDLSIAAFSKLKTNDLDKVAPNQLAVIAGIAADKAEKLDRRITENEVEEHSQNLDMVPTNLETLLGGIRNLIREFDPSLLGVKFAGERTIKEEVSDLERKLGTKFIEAEVETVEEFYGRSAQRGSGDSGRGEARDHSNPST